MSEPTRFDENDPTQSDRAPQPARGPDSFHADVPNLGGTSMGGTFVGKYQIKRELGGGGMGVVYEAMQDQPRRIVALKVMRSGARSAAWVRRFQAESQLLARLRHPYVAQVYEAGTDGFGANAVPFFVMEYVPGALPLDEYCKKNSLSIRQRLQLFSKVCEAVEHGHAHGIIHRDLKPGNLLVDSSGMPKVIDFGVARADDADQVSAELQTQAHTMVGTIQYMSPEHCHGDPSAIDARSDVYSLGVVLYEILCRRSPYDLERMSSIDASRVISEVPPIAPSSMNCDVRGELETVLLTALQKSPDRRYKSAAALRTDIERVLAGETIEARRDSATYVMRSQLRRGITRHRLATGLIVLAASMLLTFLVGMPLVHTWTPVDRAYQRSLVRWFDRSSNTPLQAVRVITLIDSTDIAGLAAQEHLAGILPTEPKSMRRLYGRLMQKLVSSGAKVVVFDMSFVDPTEFDADFVKGVVALKAAGKDVVVGTRSWAQYREGLASPVSPAIAAHAKAGCMVAALAPNAPWALELVAQHEDSDPLASLALMTVAQYRNPGSDLSMAVRDFAERVRLRYHKEDPAAPGFKKVVGEPGEIALTNLRAELVDTPTVGLKTGTWLGRYMLRMPSDRALVDSSIEISRVFSASDAQLREWFDARVVMVADIRANRDGPFETPEGRRINGCFAQATGIDALLRDLSIEQLRFRGEIVLATICCMIGMLIASRDRRSVRSRLVVLAAAIVGLFVVAIVAYRQASLLFDPFVYALGLLISFAIFMFAQRIARSAVS